MPWFQNFHAQLTTHSATLNIAPGTLTQVAADRDLVILMNDACNNADAYSQEVTAFREQVVNSTIGTSLPANPTLPPALVAGLGSAAAIQARTRQLAAQIKAHTNYNDAIGESLGIIGALEADADVSIESATALGASDVRLLLFMAGFANVAVFRQRGGGGWEQIGISNQAEFIDGDDPLAGGQPETRQYRVQAYVNNQLTGPTSDIVSVVTIP